MDEAVRVVDQWMMLPQVQFLAPGAHHWSEFRRFVGRWSKFAGR